MSLKEKTKELHRYIDFKNVKKKSVSDVDIYWHIEHSILVIERVLDSLEYSDPANFSKKFNINWFAVKLVNQIPRGSAKAPQKVSPTNQSSPHDLAKRIYNIDKRIDSPSSVKPDSFVEHHVFGHLNTINAHRFLTIHTDHHLKIIRDILK